MSEKHSGFEATGPIYIPDLFINNVRILNRWSRPSKLTASDGVTLKKINHGITSYQQNPANGDRFYIYFICSGDEDALQLGSYEGKNSGIFDIYINNNLDSSGYDNYNVRDVDIHRQISLYRPIIIGFNLIELRVNGKNIKSSRYFLFIYGASLQ